MAEATESLGKEFDDLAFPAFHGDLDRGFKAKLKVYCDGLILFCSDQKGYLQAGKNAPKNQNIVYWMYRIRSQLEELDKGLKK